MTEAEKQVFLRRMLDKLGSGGGDLGPDDRTPGAYETLRNRFLPGGMNLGAGSREATPELISEAGLGDASSFGGSSQIPIPSVLSQLPDLSPEEIEALETLLASKMNVLAQRGMGR